MNKKDLSDLDISGESLQVLTSTALFRNEFYLNWIAQLHDIRSSSASRILQELVKEGWLTSSTPGIYKFSKENKRGSLLGRYTSEERIAHHKSLISCILLEPINDVEKVMHLCPHLQEITNDVIGCQWLKRAGDIYRKNSIMEEARECYQKVVNDMSLIKGDDVDELFIETSINYAQISMAARDTSQIIAILEEALARAETSERYLGHKALLKMELAKNAWLQSRFDTAIQYFQEGNNIAKCLNDKRISRKVALYNIYYYVWQGRFKEVINDYEMFLPEITSFPQSSFSLQAIRLAAYAYFHAGQMNQALGLLEALKQHTEEIGDYHSQCHILGTMSKIMYYLGRKELSLQYHIKYCELSARVHNEWLIYNNKLSQAYFAYISGNIDKAVFSLNEFDRFRSKMQVDTVTFPIFLMELCWAMELGKLPKLDNYSLHAEIQKSRQGENVYLKGLAYRFQAFLKEKEGASHEEIIKYLNFSVQWLEVSGAHFERARSQVEMANRLLAVNEEEKAKELSLAAGKILMNINEEMIPKPLRLFIEEEPSHNIVLEEILKLGQEIAKDQGGKTLVTQIIFAVNRLTHAERGAMFLWEKGELKCKGSQNLTPAQISSSAFLPSMRTIKDVAHTGCGCIREMNTDHLLNASSSENMIRSHICVPMQLREKVIGVLYHDSRLTNSSFRKSDLKLLSYFAAQAAVLLENISSYEKIQELNKKLNTEKEYLEDEYKMRMHWGNIIGDGPAVKGVMTRIEKVAKIDSNVLILGETGVGKELVANAIHKNSLRSNKPFIVIQCSALTESLVQSELFGHEKGSFTGATKRKLGRIELAHGGTLFMDEIGDISMEVQVRLLRVIQTKRFERIGGNDTLQSDFRLITATNRNLEAAVRDGTFRLDLYYRLNVFPVYVPPLRERKDDIPSLVQYFLSLHSKRIGKYFKGIHEDALNLLMNYDWPGNIRELENTIERGMILNQPPILKTIDLPSTRIGPGPSNTDSFSPSKSFATLDENERCHILRALKQSNWRVGGSGGAADILKINPSTLRFRIKKMGIKQ